MNEETKFGNGYERNKELDKKLSTMTERELDTLILNLRDHVEYTEHKSQTPSTNTSKYIIPWSSPAGRAYPKWAADMLTTYSEGISTKDENFLHSIVTRTIRLTQDNVQQLRWLGDRHKINPTTGNEERDAAIWSYVHGNVSWKEMREGKSVNVLGDWGGRH